MPVAELKLSPKGQFHLDTARKWRFQIQTLEDADTEETMPSVLARDLFAQSVIQAKSLAPEPIPIRIDSQSPKRHMPDPEVKEKKRVHPFFRKRNRRGQIVTDSSEEEVEVVQSSTEKERLALEANAVQGESSSYSSYLPRIERVHFRSQFLRPWYSSPYPEEYNHQPIIHLCEFCLKYTKTKAVLDKHAAKCPLRHPPGNEIYRDGQYSIWEVEGRKNKIYCSNLCLVGKMFIDHKTLFYDVEPFLFYVLTENDDSGAYFVGYFSKERHQSSSYNLSCIMTLPTHQRKGLGQFLIDFSYLLSRVEQRPGSPEKPLSELGALTYRKYWRNVVLSFLAKLPDHTTQLSIPHMSLATGLTADDIITTLEYLKFIYHVPLTRSYEIHYSKRALNGYIKAYNKSKRLCVNEKLLRWSPSPLSVAPGSTPIHGHF